MAHYIMERPLFLLCLLAVIHSGSSLKCISCKGTKDCKGNEVTCTGKNDRCSTSVLSISSFFYSNHRIIKSCSNTTGPSKYTVLSTDRMANLSLQEIYCDSDLCNNQGIFNSAPIVNGLNCYGCISTGKECNSRVRTQLQCTGDQNQCVDIGIIGTFGSTGDTSLKGCGQITACSEDLRYSSQNASVRVQCCDGNFCNDAIEMTKEDKTPNGISCYSCESVNGRGCSPKEVSTVQCHGPLTSCMEVAGIKNQDGNPMPHVIKGCATPAMCNSSVVTLLQNLDRATVQCCSGNLCNNKVTEASLQKDGLPSSETVPPNTGVYNGSPNGSLSAGFNAISNGSIPYNSGYNTNNSNPNMALPGVYNGSSSGSSSTGSNVVGNGSIPHSSGYNSNNSNPSGALPGVYFGSSSGNSTVGSNGSFPYNSGYNTNNSNPNVGLPGVYNGSPSGSSSTGSNVVGNGSIPNNSGNNSSSVSNSNFTNPRLPPPSSGFSTGSSIEHNAVGNSTVTHSSGYNGTVNTSHPILGINNGSSLTGSNVVSNGSIPYNSGYNSNNSNPSGALPGVYVGSSSGNSYVGSNGSFPYNSGYNTNNSNPNVALPGLYNGSSSGSSSTGSIVVGNGSITHNSGYNSNNSNPSGALPGVYFGSSSGNSSVGSNGSFPYNSGYNTNNSKPNVALPGVYNGSSSSSSSTGSNVVGNGSIPHNSGNNSSSVSNSNFTNPRLPPPSSGFSTGSSIEHNAVGNGTVTHSSGYNGTVNTSHPILGINNGSSLTGSNVVSNGSIPYNSGYNSNNSNPSVALPGVYVGSPSGSSSTGSNVVGNGSIHSNISNPNLHIPGFYNGSSTGYNSGDNSNSFFANGNNTSVIIPGLSSSGTYNNIPDPNSGNGSYIDGSLNPNNVYNPDLINSSGRNNGSEFEDTLSGHNTNGNITQSNKAGLSPVGSSLIILTFVLLKILN